MHETILKKAHKCNVCGNELKAAEGITGGVKVNMGSIGQARENKHWIEWVEVIANGQSYRQFLVLKPGDPPETSLPITVAKIKVHDDRDLPGL